MFNFFLLKIKKMNKLGFTPDMLFNPEPESG